MKRNAGKIRTHDLHLSQPRSIPQALADKSGSSIALHSDHKAKVVDPKAELATTLVEPNVKPNPELVDTTLGIVVRIQMLADPATNSVERSLELVDLALHTRTCCYAGQTSHDVRRSKSGFGQPRTQYILGPILRLVEDTSQVLESRPNAFASLLV